MGNACIKSSDNNDFNKVSKKNKKEPIVINFGEMGQQPQMMMGMGGPMGGDGFSMGDEPMRIEVVKPPKNINT